MGIPMTLIRRQGNLGHIDSDRFTRTKVSELNFPNFLGEFKGNVPSATTTTECLIWWIIRCYI